MSEGKLLAGHSGMAGEIGHITVEPSGRPCGCGNVGCLETVATDLALARLISQKTRKNIEIDRAIELVRSGKIEVDAEIQRTIEYLAIGIAAVINIFNPAAVFVHARMLDIHESVFPRLLELVGRRALGPAVGDCKILRASVDKLQSTVAGTIHYLTTVLGPKV